MDLCNPSRRAPVHGVELDLIIRRIVARSPFTWMNSVNSHLTHPQRTTPGLILFSVKTENMA